VAGNPHLTVAITRGGGHCAFVEEPMPGYDGYWAEREILRFASEQLDGRASGVPLREPATW
jgi:predicted alpha/beta-fold hydrolase